MYFPSLSLLLLFLTPLTHAAPVPAPAATDGYTVTCYYDHRAAIPLAIEAILARYEDDDTVLEYPWELSNYGVVLRANGDTMVKTSTAVREATDYIVKTCKPENGSYYGGLVDLVSHRVRLASPAT